MSLNNRLNRVGTNSTVDTNKIGTGRAEKELQIGLNNKKFIDSKFTKLIEAPTMLVDYYNLDENMSSYSENLKLSRDVTKSLFYRKIERFVMYNTSLSEKIEDKGEEERDLTINLTDQQAVILSGTIRPKERDFIIFKSNEGIKKPFMVNKVTPRMLVDREVYLIEMSESQIFSYEELEAQVVSKHVYMESNVGSGNKVILESSLVKSIQEIQVALARLNRLYIEVFYNRLLDAVVCSNPKEDNVKISLRSLIPFQRETSLLRFGFDDTTLILNPDEIIPDEQQNYDKSFYRKLINGKKIFGRKREPYYGNIDIAIDTMNYMQKFSNYCVNDRIEEDYDDDFSYVFKDSRITDDLNNMIDPGFDTGVYIRFYFNVYKDQFIGSRWWNQGFTHIELMERKPVDLNNIDVVKGRDDIPFFDLSITNPLYLTILLAHRELDTDGFKNELTKKDGILDMLKNYSIYSNDIQDMIMFPVTKYILNNFINEVTKDEMTTSY
ncbi:MAG: hypothetical protein ACRC92_20475 [Peptostreptococcaceae bacterium]